MKNRENRKIKERKYLASNYYLVAIYTKEHQNLLGEMVEGIISLNDQGEIVQELLAMDCIEKYSVMPSWVYAIVRVDIKLVKHQEEQDVILKDVIKEIKSKLTKEVYKDSKGSKKMLWQRSYYSKFIRDDRAYKKAEWYVENSDFMIQEINSL